MMKLERKGDGPVRLIIECVHQEAFDVVGAALDCFSWNPRFLKDPEYEKARRVCTGNDTMDENETLWIIGPGKKDKVEE